MPRKSVAVVGIGVGLEDILKKNNIKHKQKNIYIIYNKLHASKHMYYVSFAITHTCTYPFAPLRQRMKCKYIFIHTYMCVQIRAPLLALYYYW